MGLSLWGRCHLATDQLDMTLGLPHTALARLGVTDVPEGYMMLVPLRGTLDAPAPDLKTVSVKLAQLHLRQHARANAARQQQEAKQQQAGASEPKQQQRGFRGLISAVGGKLLDAAARAVVPTVAQVSEIEAVMAADMASIPRLKQASQL